MSEPIISVNDLRVSFATDAGEVNGIRGVSFDLGPKEVLGVVGESGSGKSVTGLTIMGLLARNAKISGSAKVFSRDVNADGTTVETSTELVGLKEHGYIKIRGRNIAMIFQDPLASLNPVYRVGWQLSEAIRAHQPLNKDEARARSIELLEMVGIPNAHERIDSYPHEFSGGMRQRVVIAAAMANDPSVIIADEPTTALDVTVQAQVLESLRNVLEHSQASLILITHDLGVIAGIANRVAVMYAGRIVEMGTVEDIFYRPSMPYTHGLLGSVPRVDGDGGERLRQIPGAPPSLVGEKPGCPFAPRCPMRTDLCLKEEPELRVVKSFDETGASGFAHVSACHYADQVGESPIGQMFPDNSSADTTPVAS
jgi:oligopeptide/dipeptide ABC transporter ATP-binding protein